MILSSCFVLRFLIASSRKMCSKNNDSLTLMGCPSIYEGAWNPVTKCLRIPVNGHSPHVCPHFLVHFLVFHIVFLLFLWAFPIFPLVFRPVSNFFRSYVLNIDLSQNSLVFYEHEFCVKYNLLLRQKYL